MLKRNEKVEIITDCGGLGVQISQKGK